MVLADILSYPSLDIFAAVHSGSVSYGVVPFENSTNGSVIQTLDLFADRQKHLSNIYVCGEAYLDVHHNLLGHAPSVLLAASISGDRASPESRSPVKPRVKPLKDIRHLKRILSHPQAFGQCEAFLSTYLKGVERQDVTSTSKAAEIVSRDPTGATAAISSKSAASVHDLDVLAEGIEDRDDNTTRFLFLCRAPYNKICAGPHVQQERDDVESWKTLVAFTIDHHTPGALADALMVFKTYNLNLTSINSRPSRISPWHYIFFVEFAGRKAPGGHGPVNEAFGQLKAITKDCRWYGSWINRLRR